MSFHGLRDCRTHRTTSSAPTIATIVLSDQKLRGLVREKSPSHQRALNPTRLPESQRIRRNIGRHQTCRADGDIVADRDPGQHDCATSDPDVLADSNWQSLCDIRCPSFYSFVGGDHPLARQQRMESRQQLHSRAEHRTSSDPDLRRVEEYAVDVYEGVSAEVEVFPIIAEKRRLDPYIFANFAEQLGKNVPSLCGVSRWGCRECRNQRTGAVSGGNQFFVASVVRPAAEHPVALTHAARV